MSRFVPIRIVRYLSGLTPPPIRLTNQPKTAATTPQKPAPASSQTDPESERHHPRGLGLVARRRAPKDGSTRHAAAPHTRQRRAGPATKTETPGTTARRCAAANNANLLAMGAFYVAPRTAMAMADAFLESSLGSGYEDWDGFYEYHRIGYDECENFDYEAYKANGFEVVNPGFAVLAEQPKGLAY